MEDRDRTILRQYLLGELPDAERSELALRYFVDDEFFDRLLDLENELFDEYISGQLSPDDRKAFGDYLISLPEGASKLATAYLLREAGREEHVSPIRGHEAVPFTPSKWAVLREWFPGGGPVLRYASVAIGIVLLASLAYLVVTQRESRRDLEQLRAERAQDEREKALLSRDSQAAQQEQVAQRDRIQQLELQLAQERERQSQENSQRGGNIGAVMASLILTPSLRSGGAPDVLTLASTVKTVSLSIPVGEGEQVTSYRAVLQTVEGRMVLTRKGLRSQASRRGRTVTLRLPAARLTSDNFKLTLQGTAADGIEIAQDYYFNIVRKSSP